MTEQFQPKSPPEEMVKFWQAWMSAGLDAMQRTAALFAPGAAGLQAQIEKAVRASLETAGIPSAQELQRLVEEVGGLRTHVQAMRTGIATLEALVKGQQEMWRALEGSVRQATKVQQELQQAIANWSSQSEDRVVSVMRVLEESRQRWDEMLRQGIAVSQTSQKSLEDLTQRMLDLSQKGMGGKRGSDKKS